jgi:ribonuclease-3|tara:strand:+ start:194 stop:862 length:669 start_codon:yes stop_codon:yes gene_type:complete
MINRNFISFQNDIKINFKNLKLLETCLTHKSSDKINNNEKLEFLGDRVLGLVLSKTLIKIYPNEKEGIIDKKFANLVNRRVCAKIANKLNIKKFMVLGATQKKSTLANDKIVSDCLEALIGAIYLDKGIDAAEKFILNKWSEYLDKSAITEIDSKTMLQEYSLKKFKELPKYKMNKQTGPHHSPLFNAEVKIRESKIFVGSGSSKKNAQQDAAKKLLIELKV